jgi:predicted SAM-dependent methyltransferase
MEWSEVQAKDPIYLNLGGAEYCHPTPRYEGYVAVDLNPLGDGWSVKHDLTQPIPLTDGSVTRIHTEDFLEHVTVGQIEALLNECYRLLAPGGTMRIGVPDYNNPKDRPYLEAGSDPRYPLHVTLTHYEMIKEIVERSPFERHQFYHYWDGDKFVANQIDYSKGMIRRTPDNDPKCRSTGLLQRVKTSVRDFFYLLSRGFRVSELDMAARKGHPLHVTSLTFDLFKDPAR